MARLTIPTTLFVLVLLLLGSTHLLRAQTVDLDKDRLPIAPLPSLWRFHTGDNPAWADPKFDDSGWSLLQDEQSWTTQGYRGYKGVAWYRFEVILPAGMNHASLLLQTIFKSYEIYSNGTLIGTYGKMPPDPKTYIGGGPIFAYTLPSMSSTVSSTTPIQAQHKIKIAVRVWCERSDWCGPLPGDPMVGDSQRIEERRQMVSAQIQWAFTADRGLHFLESLACFGALVLFLLRRQETEYLWFSLYMFFNAASGALDLSLPFSAWNLGRVTSIYSVLITCSALSMIAFYRKLVNPRSSVLLRMAIASAVLSGISNSLANSFPGTYTSWVATLVSTGLSLPATVWIVSGLISAARRNSIDARLLLFPMILDTLVRIFSDLVYVSNVLGWQDKITDRLLITTVPFRIEFHHISSAFFLLAIFAILVLRFTRTRTEQERYAAEIEGARSVQQFLIPEDLPQIPGLTIESDYRPAREVGGDFFQIIPNPEDDSALIFVGDVAGKGMQAGMLATLLVGALRTAATFTRDPAVILGTLNNRLCGKGNATALALHIESSGAAKLVNAGHLPPYLNGIELPMEGALPLGTIPNLDFPILHFQINSGDTLTLISDGILEAQKPDGELFGFDRIAELLRQDATAASLASAAQAFGQSDDITVLTLSRPATLVSAGSASLAAPV